MKAKLIAIALAGLLGAGTIGTASAIGVLVLWSTIRLAWLKCLTK